MENETPRRYPGARWTLRYGAWEGVERTAVTELQRMVQDYLPYVLEVGPAAGRDLGRGQYVIAVGTPASNELIAELVQAGTISLPDAAEGYTITCRPSPWEGKERALIIAGTDPKGLLNPGKLRSVG